MQAPRWLIKSIKNQIHTGKGKKAKIQVQTRARGWGVPVDMDYVHFVCLTTKAFEMKTHNPQTESRPSLR
jgi:hypothetical protein